MPAYDAFEKEVASFLRGELAQRYDIDNIRKYSGFDALSDNQIDALCDFGLRHIYPDWETRCFQQAAFEALMTLLNNPTRLKPLIAVALKSLWRFGRQLPRAIEAGKKVVSAFEATRRLEQKILVCLHTQHPDNAAIAPENITDALRTIPRNDFDTYINDTVALMRLLAERSLLDTGFSVLKDISAAMEKRTDCYNTLEIESVLYALDIMEEGMALFDSLDNAAVEAAITAIPAVEWDWYENVIAG